MSYAFHISERVYDFDWPARELFIWAVLMRRSELALLFLRDSILITILIEIDALVWSLTSKT